MPFAALLLFRRISDKGFSSSSETPVTRSTYSRSSTAILVTGTAIFTPFNLCKWIFPSFKPMNSASTLNDPDLSVHVRVLDASGSMHELAIRETVNAMACTYLVSRMREISHPIDFRVCFAVRTLCYYRALPSSCYLFEVVSRLGLPLSP